MQLARLFRPPLRPRWASLGMALGTGAAAGLGQAPLGWWPVALIALAGLLHMMAASLRPGQVAWLGFAAGFGYALSTLYWIVEPFFVEPEIYGWMAPFALVLMAAGMGAFWALGAGIGALAGQGRAARGLGAALGLAGMDALRSYVFTGFPWALLGHVWIDTPVAQAAGWIGPLGLGALTVLLAGGPIAVSTRGARLGAGAAGVAVLAGLWMWGAERLSEPMPERFDAPVIRIVQPNAEQHLKWLPEHRLEYFYRHLDLTAAPPAEGEPRPDLIVWPETAVPFLLDRAGEGLEMIAEAANGRPVALGIQRSEGARYYNSLAVIAPDATVAGLYDKAHLVPFGEYIPFGDVMARFGIAAFAAQQGNGYSAGPGARLLDLGALGKVAPLICYEAIFPQDLRGVGARPDWLLQVTNDAWFGNTSGPWQHLAQARFRAIEQGLPMVRAANTGISALIDARGQVVKMLGLGEIGTIDARLPPGLDQPPYARWGDWPALGFIVALWAFLAFTARNRVDRKSTSL